MAAMSNATTPSPPTAFTTLVLRHQVQAIALEEVLRVLEPTQAAR